MLHNYLIKFDLKLYKLQDIIYLSNNLINKIVKIYLYLNLLKKNILLRT